MVFAPQRLAGPIPNSQLQLPFCITDILTSLCLFPNLISLDSRFLFQHILLTNNQWTRHHAGQNHQWKYRLTFCFSFHPASLCWHASSLISAARAALIGPQLIELSFKWKSLCSCVAGLHPMKLLVSTVWCKTHNYHTLLHPLYSITLQWNQILSYLSVHVF